MENAKALSKANELEIEIGKIQTRISDLESKQEINFPPNYSVGNALRAAWLTIQDTKDLNSRPALEVCTRESVINSLFNTVVQGLNPAKKQVYYIVYGNQLQAQRSYFGTMAVTKRLYDVKDVYADVVYKNDVFRISKARGNWRIDEHASSFENIDPANIVAAYCVIERTDGTEYIEVMNMVQIQAAWNKSRAKSQTTHKEFPDQMAKKTVINRACKNFANTSDDSDIFIEAFNSTGNVYEEEPTAQPRAEDNRLKALNGEIKQTKHSPPSSTPPTPEPVEEPENLEAEIKNGQDGEEEDANGQVRLD